MNRLLPTALLVTTLVSGCDDLTARGEDEGDTAAGAVQTDAHIAADAVAACQAAHARRRAEAAPLPEPDRVVDCRAGGRCRVEVELGLDRVPPPPEPPVVATTLQLDVSLADGLLEQARLGRSEIHLELRSLETGAELWTRSLSEDGVRDTVPVHRAARLVARFDDPACNPWPAGVLELATVDAASPDTMVVEATVSTQEAVRVTGVLSMPDDVLPERTAWALTFLPADGSGAQRAGGAVYAVATTAGPFEVEVFAGVYDVFATRLDTDIEAGTECEPYASERERASFGTTRIARDVTIGAGVHLDLEVRPIELDVRVDVSGHEPEPWDRRVNVSLRRLDDTHPWVADKRGFSAIAGEVTRVLTWPGTWQIEAQAPTAHPQSQAWRRTAEVALEAPRASFETDLVVRRLDVELVSPDEAIDTLAADAELEVIEQTRDDDDIDFDALVGEPLYVVPGRYDVELAWAHGCCDTTRRWPLADTLVVDTEDVAVRLEMPALGVMRALDPFSADDRGHRDAYLTFVDPTDGVSTDVRVDNPSWLDTGIAEIGLPGGVYDVIWRDTGGWPVASCVPVDGGGAPRAITPAWRTLELQLPGEARGAEVSYRMLGATTGIVGHAWTKPEHERLGGPPFELQVIAGRYEMQVEQGDRQSERFILEVR